MINRLQNKKLINGFYIVILFMLIIVSSLPAFRSGIYNGHDLWYHMGRIQSIAEELANGQFPVRYEAQSWYGNGYISTTMYGNIFLYIPAILYNLGLPLYRAYNIYLILVNIAGTLIALYSFKGIFKDIKWAIVATLMHMLAGYYLVNLYVRAALGEYTATIFMPLIAYGIYRIYFEENNYHFLRKISPLVLGYTGIINSHILSAVMVTIAVLAFALIYIKETLKHIKELLLAMGLTLLINAFFIVPFLDFYLSFDFYADAGTVGTNIQQYGMYLSQIFGLFPLGSGGRSAWSTVDEDCFRIGLLHVLGFVFMVIAIIINIIKRNKSKASNGYKLALTCFVIGLIAAFLSSVYFPWKIFTGDNPISNVMRSVQYPNRYFVIVSFCWTLCGTFAIKFIYDNYVKSNRIAIYLGLIVLIGAIAIAQTGIFMYSLSYRNTTITSLDDFERDVLQDSLYIEVGTDLEKLNSAPEVINGVDCEVVDLGYEKGSHEYLITNNGKTEAQIHLPILSYKYIYAFTESGEEIDTSTGDNNQIVITVPEGFSDKVSIKFVEPVLWRISEIVSVLAFACMIWWIMYRKKMP